LLINFIRTIQIINARYYEATIFRVAFLLGTLPQMRKTEDVWEFLEKFKKLEDVSSFRRNIRSSKIRTCYATTNVGDNDTNSLIVYELLCKIRINRVF